MIYSSAFFATDVFFSLFVHLYFGYIVSTLGLRRSLFYYPILRIRFRWTTILFVIIKLNPKTFQ